jgi:hypothetical protein
MGEIGGKAHPHARLRGRWLALVRVAWLGVTALSLGLFALSVPAGYSLLKTVCVDGPCGPEQLRPGGAERVRDLGVSLDVYAAYQTAVVVVVALVFCVVAAVVFWRRSNDVVALYTSLTLVLCGVFLPDWVGALTIPPSLWFSVDLLNTLVYCSLFVLFYVFPDGRFAPRWTRLPALAWISLFGSHYVVPGGPFAVANWPPALLAAVITALIGTCLFAQVYRYRRVSGPEERQQTKWVVFGLSLMLVILAVASVPPILEPSLEDPGTTYDLALDLVSFGALLLVPLSFGVAVLRYRLFDIDVIINRALVYGALTISLALFYAGAVAGLQYALRALAGGGTQLAVVASTLAIAALFGPLRRSIQALIDRAFYRGKYDAGRVLGAYASRLRDETDLPSLGDGLAGVVIETVQPAHVSLWLREPGGAQERSARGGDANGQRGPEAGPSTGGGTT